MSNSCVRQQSEPTLQVPIQPCAAPDMGVGATRGVDTGSHAGCGRRSHTGRGHGSHTVRGHREPHWTWVLRDKQDVDAGATRDVDVGAARDMDAGATRDVDVGAAWDMDTGATRGVDVGAMWDMDTGATRDVDVGATWDMDAGATRDVDVGAMWDMDAGAMRDVDAGRNLLLPNRSDKPSATGPHHATSTHSGEASPPCEGRGRPLDCEAPDHSCGRGSSRVKPSDDIPAKRQGPNQAAKARDD
ncbi:hypothetical protein E5288_WYG022223 [Bos mutus]|uniref:Uncharacterized protein n=1 Tax=Bos mutus TaxID=72004 RepID=A0A6B0S275_9CETA|nr:hypothetical protein [Bos mutus]